MSSNGNGHVRNGHQLCNCEFCVLARTDFREAWGRYMASREWSVRRRAVMERASGRCERCCSEATKVHHATYNRRFHERLDDLVALCRPCHTYVSGKSDLDPVAETMRRAMNGLGDDEWHAYQGTLLQKAYDDEWWALLTFLEAERAALDPESEEAYCQFEMHARRLVRDLRERLRRATFSVACFPRGDGGFDCVYRLHNPDDLILPDGPGLDPGAGFDGHP